MSKADKLAEARFFLREMEGTDERDPFRFRLSAFLSAARSVLQYADRDVGENPSPGRGWYDTMMASSHVLSFLRDERNANIHSRPVRPTRQVTVEARMQVNIQVSSSVVVRRSDGSTEEMGASKPAPRIELPPAPGNMTVRYFFTDPAWDPQDVVEFCQWCIDELQAAIDDGLAKGFILP